MAITLPVLENDFPQKSEQLKAMSKRELLENISEVEEIVNRPGQSANSQPVVQAILKTVLKNSKPKTLINDYGKLISVLPELAVRNYFQLNRASVRCAGPPIITEKKKFEIEAMINSSECSLNSQTKEKIRKRLTY
jgi:hypothetical protein